MELLKEHGHYYVKWSGIKERVFRIKAQDNKHSVLEQKLNKAISFGTIFVLCVDDCIYYYSVYITLVYILLYRIYRIEVFKKVFIR